MGRQKPVPIYASRREKAKSTNPKFGVSSQLSPLDLGNFPAKGRRNSGAPACGDSGHQGIREERDLERATRPTTRVPDRCEGVTVERCGAMSAQGFQMFGRGVALVLRQAVLGLQGGPLPHARI